MIRIRENLNRIRSAISQAGGKTGARVGIGAVVLILLLFISALWTTQSKRAVKKTVVSENYASPLEVLLSQDGSRLYVLCQQSGEVRVLNANTYAVEKNIAVGHVPRGFSLSPDGARLFVVNSWDDSLSVIDTGKLSVVATWKVGAQTALCGQSHQQRYRCLECAERR